MQMIARLRPVPLFLLVAMLAPGCFGPAIEVEPVPNRENATLLAAALLRDIEFQDLIIEVDHAPGRAPSAAALASLLMQLENVTAKHTITIDGPTELTLAHPFAADDHAWTMAEVESLHDAAFDGVVKHGYGENGTARIHVLYLQGTCCEDIPLVGRQVDDLILIMADELRRSNFDGIAAPIAARDAENQERSTLIHEFGHAMGLVNSGIPMTHAREDPENPAHSTNPKSVMSVRRHTALAFLEDYQDNQWEPYRFDADDLADLAAFRRG